MLFKMIVGGFLFGLCIYLCYKFRERPNSIICTIAVGVIIELIVAFFVPSDISIFHILNNEKEGSIETNTTNSKISKEINTTTSEISNKTNITESKISKETDINKTETSNSASTNSKTSNSTNANSKTSNATTITESKTSNITSINKSNISNDSKSTKGNKNIIKEDKGSKAPQKNNDAPPDKEENSEPPDNPELPDNPEPPENNEELIIQPIVPVIKSIDSIEDNLLAVNPIDLSLSYCEGVISTEAQIDTYQFVPSSNGRYRFEVSEIQDDVKINILILNQAGEIIADTSSGVEIGNGLTMDDMTANEIYTIQIKQYLNYGSYKILFGCQKDVVNIDNSITQIIDSIQYTDQRNIYQFAPTLNGQYHFELTGMDNETAVNMSIYNSNGEELAGISDGIANGGGFTIDMNVGETYNIAITQYINNTNYNLLIRSPKEIFQINGETEITDSIQYTDQKNQYQFIPPINGRYRFELSDLVDETSVNIHILNQAGEEINGMDGLTNNDGLTIDNLTANEIYLIQVSYYNSCSPYTLKIGYQKETIPLSTNNVSDSMQYTHQRNVYQFKPSSNGNYSFAIDKMIDEMKINISVYNKDGECINEISNGITNGNGLSIENMTQDEIYTIYVTQYEGNGSYSLIINSY